MASPIQSSVKITSKMKPRSQQFKDKVPELKRDHYTNDEPLEQPPDKLIKTDSLNNESEVISNPKQKTLLNFFIPTQHKKSTITITNTESANQSHKNPSKPSQYFLDLGQKDFGLTTCKICLMKYVKGDANDVKLHEKFHKTYLNGIILPLGSDKEEKMIDMWLSGPHQGTIICIHYWIAKSKQLKKLQELFKIIGQETGDVDAKPERLKNSKIYIYLTPKRQILGCIIVEPIKTSYPIDTTSTVDQSIKTKQNSSVGIHRMWTKSSERQKGVCSRMLKCIQENFCLTPVPSNRLAFYQPTHLGILTAKKFYQSEKVWAYDDDDIAS